MAPLHERTTRRAVTRTNNPAVEGSEAMELSSAYIKSEPSKRRLALLSPLPAVSSSTIPLAAPSWVQVKFWRGRGKNMGHVQTELKVDVLRITLDRPEKKNALSNAMYTALAEAVEQAETNPVVRVMLLHGNGDSFTAGNDLEDFVANPW